MIIYCKQHNVRNCQFAIANKEKKVCDGGLLRPVTCERENFYESILWEGTRDNIWKLGAIWMEVNFAQPPLQSCQKTEL